MYTAGTPNDFESTDDTRDGETKPGRPNPYMVSGLLLGIQDVSSYSGENWYSYMLSCSQHPPSPWMTQRPLGVDVNIGER